MREGGGEHRAGTPNDGSNRESDDSSSGLDDDDTSDEGRATSDAAAHLEEVYGQIPKALHKTTKIMCTGYERATGDVQGIFRTAVQQAMQPNRTYIWATTGHLSEWGQTLHDMLNCEGTTPEERERASRAARLARLKCVQSLLKQGQALSEAEEQDTDQRLHNTIQAALKVAYKQANNTFIKINKQIPRIIRRYVPDNQARTFIASVYRSMGDHQLSLHRMVMSPGSGALSRRQWDIPHEWEYVPGVQQCGARPLCSGHQVPGHQGLCCVVSD